MTRYDSDRINDFFAGSSCDLTPAPVRHAAHVLYAPVSHDPEVTRRCASVLSDTELQRAEPLCNTKATRSCSNSAGHFAGSVAPLALGSSQPLSQIAFEETENGRPYLSGLPDFWFSFSSCRFGFLGAWSSTHGIGVDLEDQTKESGGSRTRSAVLFGSRGECC